MHCQNRTSEKQSIKEVFLLIHPSGLSVGSEKVCSSRAKNSVAGGSGKALRSKKYQVEVKILRVARGGLEGRRRAECLRDGVTGSLYGSFKLPL